MHNIELLQEDELDLRHVNDKKIQKRLIESYAPMKDVIAPVEMEIVLQDEKPVFSRPRKLPVPEEEEVEKQVQKWLSEGIIRPSCSDFCSPVTLVGKKDGTKRLCIDFRRINKQIVKDRYPLPIIEHQIDRLQDSVVFSTLDLENGFFHVPIKERSKKYTGFVVKDGQYEFNRVPFGLYNSPSVFQRFINVVFRPLEKQGIMLTYLDDIVVLGKTNEEAMVNLGKVLDEASQNGLQIKWKKCQFLQRKIKYLGYVVENGTIKPSTEKSLAVKNFKIPKNAKEVHSFLGLAGYFRRFVSNFSLIAKPLSDLLKKDAVFELGPPQLQAFGELKLILISEPVLKIFKYGRETELHTDASKWGYGAILLQKNSEDGSLHPVSYMSRKTTTAEEKYSSYELEVLAVIEAVKKYRVYLLGQPFKIVTDCSAFEMTMKKKDLATRVARWALLLQEFDYIVEHRAGVRMRHVDALSRAPIMLIESSIVSKLRVAQTADSNIQMNKQLLENGPFENYECCNGIMYKDLDGRKLLVVPEGMEHEIIINAHDIGHFGKEKCKEIVQREFWIKRLDEKIKRYIQNCVACILATKKSGRQEGFLHAIDKGEIPLDTFHLDHVGPLATTNKSYNHILVIVDAFSKFVWLFPTKTVNSEETIQKVRVLQSFFGNPRRFVTDQGAAFTSNSFKEFCHDEKIEHVKITTGIPRGNGQVERINGIIIPVLTKLALDDPSKWFVHVNKVQRFLNATFQRSINSTPFELLMGVKMRNAEDIKVAQVISDELINNFIDSRERLRQEARSRILEVQDENRRQFNRRRKEANQYAVGDLVAIKRTQFGTGLKVKAKYLGPYEVAAVKGNDRYELHKFGESEGPHKTSSSADQMKPWASLAATEGEADQDEESSGPDDL